MQTTDHLETTYEAAHFELNNLYNQFHQVPGYIREKHGEELALQAAKKVFGRFNPDDKDAMESNTNNGQGFDVQLDDGTTIHLKNQLDLFNKVVEFNKQKGGFCDENYIKHTNLEDYKRLTDLQFKVETAKEALIEAFPSKKAGYAKAREIETRTNKMLSSATQQGENNAGSTTKSASAAKRAPGQISQSPKMRIPLFSSIPNTFRQARTMFNKSNTQHASTKVAKYISSNDKARNSELSSLLNRNIAVATDINNTLNKPVENNTEHIIKELTKELSEGNTTIEKIIDSKLEVDVKSVEAYNIKMNKKMDEMKDRLAKHPFESVRKLISSVISNTLNTIKKLINSTKELLIKSSSSSPEID